MMRDRMRIRAEEEAEAEEEKYIWKDKEFLRNHQEEGIGTWLRTCRLIDVSLSLPPAA